MEYESIFHSIKIPICVAGYAVYYEQKIRKITKNMGSTSEQNVHDYVPTLVKSQMCQVDISFFLLHEV